MQVTHINTYVYYSYCTNKLQISLNNSRNLWEWTQIEYQDRRWNTDRKEEGTWDDRRTDGGTNSTLRIKEQEKRLTLNEYDDDDDDYDDDDDDDL